MGAAIIFAGAGLAGCGGSGGSSGASGGGSGAGGRAASYPVRVAATFPGAQRLAQHSHLVITVTNAGAHAIPDVAVTITNPKYGTAADALATLISAKQPAGQQPLAGRSRPVWVIERAPGPCEFNCRSGGASTGGAGGAVTPDANTWALGRLAPGQSARFDWGVTAVRAGHYAVAYRVAAGLSTGQKAVRAGGVPAAGTLNVRIAGRPPAQHFSSSGQIEPGG